MAKVHRRDGGLERAWRGRLRAWRRSGLDGRAFCRGEGLSEASFYAWRREIARRDHEATASARAAALPRTTSPPGTPRFVPVAIVADQGGRREEVRGLELVWPDGLALRVGPGFDAATLTRLLTVLGRPAAASAAGGAAC